MWCVEYRDRIVEKPAPPPSAAEAAAIVLSRHRRVESCSRDSLKPPLGTLPRQDGAAVRRRRRCDRGVLAARVRTVLEGLTEAAAAAGHCTAASTHPPWEPPNASWQRY